MKHFFFAVVSTILVLSASQVHAILNPSWERPVLTATLKATGSSGVLAKSKKLALTLTHRDGAPLATGMVVTFPGRSSTNFKITSSKDLGCGSTQWIAQPVFPAGVVVDSTTVVFLNDYTHRVCDDLRFNTWEATVKVVEFGHVMGEAHFIGSPTPVITAQ